MMIAICGLDTWKSRSTSYIGKDLTGFKPEQEEKLRELGVKL
jgi:hypothetical protein